MLKGRLLFYLDALFHKKISFNIVYIQVVIICVSSEFLRYLSVIKIH